MNHLPPLSTIISFMTLLACTPPPSPNRNLSGPEEPVLAEIQQHKEQQRLLNRTIQFLLHERESRE